jgi:S-DNA-T family DNA segregation ATPase FtsK/SpoIIIE
LAKARSLASYPLGNASRHLLICGTTGSGKSICLRWLLYRLFAQNSPHALRALLLDPKGDLAAFAALPHLLHPPAQDAMEMQRLLAWAVSELDRRTAARSAGPRLVLVVEEMPDLVLVHPDIGAALTRIAQVGRSAGISLIGTAQQPNVETVGKATVNFTARIVGRVASASLSYGATGRAGLGAEKLLGRGDMLFVAGGDTVRVQVPYCTLDKVRGLSHTDRPSTLADQLPTGIQWGDRQRDARGRPGRALSVEDYDQIAQDLADGASVEQLRARYGIGYSHARRIHEEYRGRDET